MTWADRTLWPEVLADIVQRASDQATYAAFVSQGEACGWCREPVRLVGRVTAVDPATGSVAEVFSSHDQPDGVVLKACGTRRATRCPSCAERYRGDARQIIAAGLQGGKGVPEDIASHPAVFATFTAPSFGAVHGVRRHGERTGVCRPAPADETCDHGRPAACQRRHQPGAPELGSPLCAQCYDYEGAVVWNARAGELWRRTTIYLRRTLARLGGITARQFDGLVRLSFAKVVEYQQRGVVHVHAVFRLDGKDGGAPPAPFAAGLLALAVRVAAARVAAPHPPSGCTTRWGEQLDVRVLGGQGSAILDAGAVANYIAKYATKSVDESGLLDRRIRSLAELDVRCLPAHLGRLARSAWQLGDEVVLSDLRLQLWAHDLGYRGHWLTKSRQWSTTFATLREERRQWQIDRAHSADPGALRWRRDVHVDGAWRFDGVGWSTAGDAHLAAGASRRRRQARILAREDALLRASERGS